MSFAAVAWSYKDKITSAKLAQMVENLRTHDHLTTDQGGRFGVLTATGRITLNQTVNTTAPTALTTTVGFTIPTNATTGRLLRLIYSFYVFTAVASTTYGITAAMTGTGSTTITGGPSKANPSAGVGQETTAIYTAPCPPAGSYTVTFTVVFSAAGAANNVNLLGPGTVELI